jgi:hypothetical protein
LFFPEKTRKKNSEIKKKQTQTIFSFTIPHIIMPSFEICLYNKPETKINQMKSVKLLLKA